MINLKIISTLILVTFLSGCIITNQSTEELLTEIHDLDTESTALYNSFNSDYVKFEDFSYSSHNSITGISTLQTYSENAKMSGQKAQIQFNELLEKIDALKKRNLNDKEEDYINKLNLASLNYNKTISMSLKLVDPTVSLTDYYIYNSLFFESYTRITDSLVNEIPGYETYQSWDLLFKELDFIESELTKASEQVENMNETLQLDSVEEYQQYISLMHEYVTTARPIFEKEKNGKNPSQSELDSTLDLVSRAYDIFISDADGIFWVVNEKDEIEKYKKENIYSYEKEREDSYNLADAYYQDAKLAYGRL